MVLEFDQRMQDRHGPEYDPEALGVGTQREAAPEPEYSSRPIISDDQIDRLPCITPGHPEDCACLACCAPPTRNLTELTITECDDEQDHQPGDQ